MHQLKTTVQRVSVALQRVIGEATVLFNRRARAFPAGPAAEEHPAVIRAVSRGPAPTIMIPKWLLNQLFKGWLLRLPQADRSSRPKKRFLLCQSSRKPSPTLIVFHRGPWKTTPLPTYHGTSPVGIFLVALTFAMDVFHSLTTVTEIIIGK